MRGVTDPEQKRKIIGALFVEIFDEEAAKISDVQFLAQGTIYPDVIESAGVGGKSHVIKSHHNVGGSAGPDETQAGRAAPQALFKDEGAPDRHRVRAARRRWCSDIRSRCPGLARAHSSKSPRRSRAETLRLADHIFIRRS